MRQWIWSGFILFLVLFSLTPTFYEIGRRNDLQPNRYFELVHNFYTDYNFYLSRIRQGREGAWTVKEKYTSEPHEGSYIQIMYLLMGKVSAWVRVPWPNSGDTYHMGRIVAAITLLYLIGFAAKQAFDRFRWQFVGFFLAATASTWPIAVYHANEWRFGGYMPWWTLMDSLQRTTFVPHMLVGQSFIVFLLLSLTSEKVMRRPGNWVFLGLLAFMLGIVFPPGLVFIFVVFGVYAMLNWKRVNFIGSIVAGCISLPSLLYLYLALSVYPWKRIVDYSLLHPQPFVLWDYVRAMGPLLPLGCIGLVLVLLKKERRMFVFVSWIIAWAALIIIFQYVPQESPLRFTEMLPHVPLGILSAFVLFTFVRSFRRTQKYVFVLLGLYGLMILGQLYSSWRWQKEFIDHKIRATLPLIPTGSYVMYPLKDLYDIMIYIQDHTKRTDVILTGTTVGNYLPVYAGNTVFVGHAGTIAAEKKEAAVQAFYQGNMSTQEMSEFLKTHNIRLVVFGPQEIEDRGVPPNLTEVYRNTSFIIYSP